MCSRRTFRFVCAFAACIILACLPLRELRAATTESIQSALADAESNTDLTFCVSGTLDGRGNLWVGTEDKGVWRAGPDGSRFFTTADGLGDNAIYAVAADKKGRIWVGHCFHGVSVFNGTSWKNYSAIDGPGGSRVFAIAVCPTDGDVWIATEAGLARYSQGSDSWSWFNRSNGLPDDQVSCLAFDSAGNLFVGLQCDGVAIAKSADQYKTWHSQTGPDVMPAGARGNGLPGPLINAMLASRAGVVYAATTRGIAWSKDQGNTWQYLRGTDWFKLVEHGYDGAPKDMVESTTPMKEDWCNSLAEDSRGNILVGHRDKGFERLSPDTFDSNRQGDGPVRAIVPLPDDSLVLCTYGRGAVYSEGDGDRGNASAPAPPVAAPFPSVAKPATIEQLDQMRRQILSLPSAKSSVEILDDDWESKGDWIGRYGREYSLFSGYSWDGGASGSKTYAVSVCTGPYAVDANVFSYEDYISKVEFPENALFDPGRHQRMASEFNDGSFNGKMFPRYKDGPDLYTAVRVPAGNHRVSLYFFNFDGHTRFRIDRDYYLQVKIPGTHSTQSEASGKQDLVEDEPDRSDGFVLPGSAAIDAEVSDTLARLRLPPFWNGCYKRILVRGPQTVWIKIGRNYSEVTKLQGIFVDGEGATAVAEDANPIRLNGLSDLKVPHSDGDPTQLPDLTGAAAKLWSALDASAGSEGYAAYCHPFRIAAYRAAASSNATDPKLLENWRWRLGLWNDQDRQQIDALIPVSTEKKPDEEQD
jgi:hypothetical protein